MLVVLSDGDDNASKIVAADMLARARARDAIVYAVSNARRDGGGRGGDGGVGAARGVEAADVVGGGPPRPLRPPPHQPVPAERLVLGHQHRARAGGVGRTGGIGRAGGTGRAGRHTCTARPAGRRERELLPPSDAFRSFGGVTRDGARIAYGSTERNGPDFGGFLLDVASGGARGGVRGRAGPGPVAWRPGGRGGKKPETPDPTITTEPTTAEKRTGIRASSGISCPSEMPWRISASLGSAFSCSRNLNRSKMRARRSGGPTGSAGAPSRSA